MFASLAEGDTSIARELLQLIVVVVPIATMTAIILLLAFMIAWCSRDQPNVSD